MCKFKFKLSFLIVSIVMVSILATSTISIWGSYQSFNEILIENKRDLKEVYRKEISNITNDYGQLEMQDSDNGIASHAAFEQAANRFLEENTVPFNALFKKNNISFSASFISVVCINIMDRCKNYSTSKRSCNGYRGRGKIQNLEEIDGWYLEAYHLKNAVLNTLTESRNRIADLTKQLR